MTSFDSGFIDGPAATAIDITTERLRRLLLQISGQDARIQDLGVAAELALQVGLREEAAALYGLMFLKTGFGAAGAALRSAIDARTELWRLPQATKVAAPQTFSVDAAIAELESLIGLAADTSLSMPDISTVIEDDRIVQPPVTAQQEDRLLARGRRVAAILREAPRLQQEGALGAALRLEAKAVLGLPEPQIEANVHQQVEILLLVFLVIQLRQFIVTRWDLLFAPSTQLFDHAGLLDRAALGPYFSNVRLILREAADLFDLVEAASAISLDREQIETWAVLLSSGFSEDEVLSLADELADRGMVRAMRALIARLAFRRPTGRSLEIVWRLRDGAMDIDALDLAVEAQRLVIHWRPTSGRERMILAELFQSQGAVRKAEDTYQRALMLDASLTAVADRLSELKTGSPRVVSRGFATSRARHLLRRGRFEAYTGKTLSVSGSWQSDV